MSDLLTSLDERGVATLTLNRPDRHNAFDDTLIKHLTEAFRRVGADPAVRIVVLTSAGRSFSAGADVEWMRRMSTSTREANLADANALAEMLHTLDTLPKPTICIVQGPTFGGGIGLVACCDMVVAARRAVFSLSEVKLGLLPATISPYVVRAIGSRHARRYFQTGEIFDAEHAQAIGLVHELAHFDHLQPAAEKLITALLMGAPGAQASAKSLIALCEAQPIGEALMAETAIRIATQRASAEGREGVDAFLSKRQPVWPV